MNLIKKAVLKIVPKIQEFEYDYIYSSRKVIKNRWEDNNPNHFYDEDIWGIVAKELKPFLLKGMTIYGEIVGYLSEGKMIQKDFDYGCKVGQHDSYIYRITTTNEDGKVFEWSMLQIQQWAKQNGLKAVPMHYYGYAKDLFPQFNIKDHWHENFLSTLQETYLEKKCTMCRKDVPNEGICLRKETLDIDVYKLKSFLFRQMETKSLDSGEVNIEDNQEVDAV